MSTAVKSNKSGEIATDEKKSEENQEEEQQQEKISHNDDDLNETETELDIPEEQPVELPPSRYSYVSRENAGWVDEILGYDGIRRLGEKPHPVELIFELTAHYVPELHSMPNIWKTPRNRLKSKLRKVRELFIAWGIQSPLHWCSFVDYDEYDERSFLNFNLSLAAMKCHFLMEERNKLQEDQLEQLRLCRQMKEDSDLQRAKIQKILKLVQEKKDLPFAGLIEQLVTKEPSCFKPLAEEEVVE